MSLEASLSLVESLVDVVAKMLRRSRLTIKTPFFQWEIDANTATADERIQKLDDAKNALAEGLAAIDELRSDALKHKKEVKEALEELGAISTETKALEAKRGEIAKILANDVSAFQEVAGIPSPAQRRRDKVNGFISGVLASIVAAGIISGSIWLYDHFKKAPANDVPKVEQSSQQPIEVGK